MLSRFYYGGYPDSYDAGQLQQFALVQLQQSRYINAMAAHGALTLNSNGTSIVHTDDRVHNKAHDHNSKLLLLEDI